MPGVKYSASIISGDLGNLAATVRELERAGIDAIHVDLLDGVFSPSLPLGLDSARKIREATPMALDAHIMAVNNEFFINEALAIGMESVTFHVETSLHVDRHINLIRGAGARVGVALNPATSLSVLEFILPQVDSVCLMLINPGFAWDPREAQVPYAAAKVAKLRDAILAQGLDVEIQVDGRVSLAAIPALVAAGATNLVLGSTSLFGSGGSIQDNRKLVDEAVAAAVEEVPHGFGS